MLEATTSILPSGNQCGVWAARSLRSLLDCQCAYFPYAEPTDRQDSLRNVGFINMLYIPSAASSVRIASDNKFVGVVDLWGCESVGRN